MKFRVTLHLGDNVRLHRDGDTIKGAMNRVTAKNVRDAERIVFHEMKGGTSIKQVDVTNRLKGIRPGGKTDVRGRFQVYRMQDRFQG